MASGSARPDLLNRLNTLFRFGVVGDLADGHLFGPARRIHASETHGGGRTPAWPRTWSRKPLVLARLPLSAPRRKPTR
jgi:hypothetical protein